MQIGRPDPLGATPDEDGTNFAVFSDAAECVELCLFSETGRQTDTIQLPACSDGIWHGYLPGCIAGQRYGYRVHGRYEPGSGLRCNPAKLLIDPYALALDGAFTWNDAVFDFVVVDEPYALEINTADSAPFVPKSVVCAAGSPPPLKRPGNPWNETIFYEANVRAYTMRHAAVAEPDRGTFNGMRNKDILAYLRALGITSLELMPVHAFIDEQHLAERQLRNLWGYNPISFFAPAGRYARQDGIVEFQEMVHAIHDAGIEVILDVVYNHTGESDKFGPTVCFRGIDNLAYYQTEPDNPGLYINDTGCGNTINGDHPRVQQIVLDSLGYWYRVMGVDGFRFDLAPILGRHAHGFSASHPLLTAIGTDARLHDAKLIAEPWDPGPGGYQLGHFPARWGEWNDRYRDAVRRFWRGDHGTSGELARRMHGSADIFEASGRPPFASINKVTSHDGFTLADVVSYEHRHNEANGEANRDGHAHNYSHNNGVEGPTEDSVILAVRRRQRLNLLATLLVSQGTPLLLAGDEFGNSQQGNNNAYAQDNDTGWLDWSGLDTDPQFTDQVRELIWLRRETPLLRLQQYVHGELDAGPGVIAIEWLNADGQVLRSHDWPATRSLALVISERIRDQIDHAAAILVNGAQADCQFRLPNRETVRNWRLAFSSSAGAAMDRRAVTMSPLSTALLIAD